MSVYIFKGNERNHMYFDGRTPRIKDYRDQVIPWVMRNGYEVYITNRMVTVRGIFSTYRDACTIDIEIVE